MHDFEHIATAPWPVLVPNNLQIDWVEAVETLEHWLNRYCGPHYSHWAFHNGTSIDYWQACVAFKLAKHKTLFLLTWA